jgi:hypothetical protein
MGPEEAHYYCGMSRDFFNREIGPLVPVIDLGGRAIGFDRLDIDAAIFQHKESNPRVASLWPKSPDSIWKPATGKGEIRKQIRGKKLCRRFTASTRAQAEAFYYYFLASDGTPVAVRNREKSGARRREQTVVAARTAPVRDADLVG